MPNATGPQPEGAALSGKIRDCAELGLKYLEARARGDATTARQIRDDIQFSECDPNWVGTLQEYAKYFGPGGGLQPIPYIRAGKIGKQVLEMKPNARVALIADWGTGTDAAVSLLQSVKQRSPDIVIHLGDIYYSGTETECDKVFLQIVNEVFGRTDPSTPKRYRHRQRHEPAVTRRPYAAAIREHSRLRRQWRFIRSLPIIVQIILALFALTWFVLVFSVTRLVVGGLTMPHP
jgi:hypothetical protein